MTWVYWISLMQAGAAPPCSPVGGASLTQEWRGSLSSRAEQYVKRQGLGSAPRGVVPLGPWDSPESHFDLSPRRYEFVCFCCWGGCPPAAPPTFGLPHSNSVIAFFDPAFHRAVRDAAAVLGSDLPGEAKGRELLKHIRSGITWDEVMAILGQRLACHAWCDTDSPTRVRAVCPDLGLTILFEYEEVKEARVGETHMPFWDSRPAFPIWSYGVCYDY